MRVLIAFLLGIAVTIGGAYYHDTNVTKSDAGNTQIVNWDVAGTVARSATEQLGSQFGRLFSH